VRLTGFILANGPGKLVADQGRALSFSELHQVIAGDCHARSILLLVPRAQGPRLVSPREFRHTGVTRRSLQEFLPDQAGRPRSPKFRNSQSCRSGNFRRKLSTATEYPKMMMAPMAQAKVIMSDGPAVLTCAIFALPLLMRP